MHQTTLLLRQVHPSFVQANKISSQVFSITSQVFRPTPKDQNQLSVYNSNKYTPQESHAHFTAIDTSYKSHGVVAVSVQECDMEGLKCEENNIPFDGHSFIDFNMLSGSQIEKKAKKLRNYAM